MQLHDFEWQPQLVDYFLLVAEIVDRRIYENLIFFVVRKLILLALHLLLVHLYRPGE